MPKQSKRQSPAVSGPVISRRGEYGVRRPAKARKKTKLSPEEFFVAALTMFGPPIKGVFEFSVIIGGGRLVLSGPAAWIAHNETGKEWARFVASTGEAKSRASKWYWQYARWWRNQVEEPEMNKQRIFDGAPWSVAKDPFAPKEFARTGHEWYIIDRNGDEYRYSGIALRNWYSLSGAEQQANQWNLMAAQTIMTQGTKAERL